MPKVVDHQQRRRLIADALLRLAAREGLERVSLRHVAEEAGVTAGMVQHYFATKDEMMRFAMTAASERYGKRVDERIAALGEDPTAASLLRTLLGGLIPRNAQELDDARVALAFQAYASARPDSAAELGAQNAQLHGFVADQILGDRVRVPAEESRRALEAATVLMGVAEGLAIHVLSAGLSAEDADAALSRAVEWALAGS